MATTVRRTSITLPAAHLGEENPLPALRTPADPHQVHERDRAGLPADMARQIGYAPLRSLLPVRRLDGYDRHRTPTDLDAIVIENDRLRATVLPGLGGRVYSLVHKSTGRELLYRNPVLQPADFGLAGAWFSGGIEWNIGATGHTTLCCAPVHAARVPAPDGGEMLRLWEWERLRDLPFQVDLWLPEDAEFLLVGVRIRNPHHRPAPVYWWSNTAVTESPDTRVIVPAEEAWHFGYQRSLRRVPVPRWQGADRTYPVRGERPADYFYEVPDSARKWIAALDGEGHGLVQTSTDQLRGRKLFLWGNGPASQRWQRWLTEPGTDGYIEIQAGLARTQLEHLRMEPVSELSWLEAYGPLSTDPDAAHGTDWTAARDAVARGLEAALPRSYVEEAYRAWLASADTEPREILAAGSGWGALEVLHGRFKLPGTPFDEATLGEEQRPWVELLHNGRLPTGSLDVPPGPTLVAAHWRELLETAQADALVEYHLGVAQWHAGDRAQAVRSWERSLKAAESCWVVRCLAVADAESGHPKRAAERYLRAFALAVESGQGDTVLGALAREAVPALLAAGRAEDAETMLGALAPGVRRRGRFRLLAAQVLLALGDVSGARGVFDAGFEVDDLAEGEETLSETWFAVAERLVAGSGPVTETVRSRARAQHPVPDAYAFQPE
ncbi:DUF5107 domain-containing protein [Streptomyces silvisoli]|uniref:DUF5107 domain-containing protein n=1 Tax=Streptomyces silvisoli TaxID=3034235 RepID=A0ABT5ZSA3_9ACTN|nr:DUF5107 domain-containing protein [Streptomyces silvisoli]MDF3292521.1 DUF5107 domain-containing protein [Streptomyces silvisoli]